MPSRRLKIAVGLLLTRGVAAFLPFADVEELSPKHLGEFCDPGEGVRHCEGTTHRVLEDGGIVSLKWGMHTDPDRILSLDTEQKNGVRLLKCTPSSLELMLPVSHTQHARVGDIIVASHFVHGCEHLLQVVDQEKEGDEPMNYNLYHRVVKVHSVQWRNGDGTLAAGSAQGKAAHVKLWTKELPSLGHAIGSIAYDFDYTPLEATDESGLDPEQTTSDSDYYRGKWIDRPSTEHLSARRLNLQNMLPETVNPNDFTPPTDHGNNNAASSDLNFKADGGHPTFGGTTVTTDDVKSLLNFQPKKVANFGWNWNFQMKAHQDISFNYTVPGSRMYLIIKKPYFKAHSKLRIRFRSYMPHENAEDTFFTDNTWVSLRSKGGKRAPLFESFQPRVKWEASFKGKGKIEVGILAQMKAHRSISENPLEMIKIPVLHKLWKPKWFGSIDFNLGNLPVTVSPGIQFKAKFFHYGTFRGSLSVGIKTHPKYHPKLLFDSFTGLRVDLHTELKETTITPPNWMVATSHFECGIALEPTIWIKGHMGHITQNTKFAAALRPYFNMTISRAEHLAQNARGENQKELVLYPFRIVGLPTNPSKRYKVRIETEMPWQYCNNYQDTPTQIPKYQTGNLRQQMDAQFAQNQQYVNNGAVNNVAVNRVPVNNVAHNLANMFSNDTNILAADKMDCNLFKRRIDSSEGLSFGEVEFHDPFNRFSFGLISQRNLLLLDIKIQLIEVTMDSLGKPFERKSAQKIFKCKTIVNGVCMPSPLVQEIYWTDGETVKIYLHAIWKENPRPWFASRIRGVAASFPEVIIDKDYIQSVVPDYKISSMANNGAVAGVGAKLPLVLVLRHAFKSYPVLLDKHNGYVPGINSSSMKSDQTIELGASFLSTWDRTCARGDKKCDPKLVLYHGDQEVASANLPHIPWNSHQRMTGTYAAEIGNERTSRIVPVSVALQATFSGNYRQSGWGHVGMVRMKFALSNLAVWNRWISPAQFTTVEPTASFRLAWALNEADPYTETNFNLIISKNAAGASVAGPGTDEQQYLRPRIGSTWFQQVSSTPLKIKPVQETAGGVHRLRFEYDIQFGEFAGGDTVIVAVQWVDQNGQTHTMDAPPFLINLPVIAQAEAAGAVAPLAVAVAPSPINAGYSAPSLVDSVEATAAPTAIPGVGPVGNAAEANTAARRLFDLDWLTGQKTDWQKGANGLSTPQQDQNAALAQPAADQCIRQDLNFAFGAGVMFRAFVKDLSLPPDLPVLGAIQMAPELGTPWQTITGFMSAPTDLNSKLPALLCRHGVCSATLPGCPEFNHNRRYYPEIKLKFKHTLGYPQGDNLTASKKTAWVPGLQTALSYTFAIMPEIIQIIVHYSKKVPKNIKYHNVISGDDACENRGYSMTKCEAVGCCQWGALSAASGGCRTAVGTGPCFNKGAKVGSMIRDDTPAAAPMYAAAAPLASSVVAAPVVGTPPPAGQLAFPQPAIVPVTPLPPQQPVVTTTPLTGAQVATTTPLTIPELTPLTKRRLDEEEGEEEDGEPRATHITVSFKDGVRYQVDNLLIDEMRKQGMFKEFEDVPSGDKPLIIDSYTVRDLQAPTGPDYSQKDSLPAGLFGVPQSPLQILACSALVGCALLGVAFAARRASGSYQRVADSFGPVE